ncbi:hypothetical protein EI94DRAFT_1705972 [Lactarius quietus]|nr:hypothetical protein EI94DRAFT_1705972 [Lactarius quietus]
MLILSLLPLFLVTACYAAPSRRANGCLPAGLLVLPANQTQLVAPKTSPNFVTLGVGYENYTCLPSGTYSSTGAVAQLFDITPLYPGPDFKKIQENAFLDWTFSTIKNPFDPDLAQLIAKYFSIQVSGQHYYIEADGKLAPVWDLRSNGPTKGNKDAIVVGKVTRTIPSPGRNTIDWQELTRTIFRIDTVAGVPSRECTPGEDTTVKFTAQFWFYGGDVGKCGGD